MSRPTLLESAPGNWQPAASIDFLRLRATMLARIRDFFAERKVMEVETPLLCANTVTDPHSTALSTRCRGAALGRAQLLYLQTSPEYAMKRHVSPVALVFTLRNIACCCIDFTA